VYADIAELIKERATLLTEIFTDKKLTSSGMNKPNRDVWQTDIAWIKSADGIIAEVTTASLGVGYEIAKAEEWGKPVLALFKPTSDKRLSAMIEGSPATSTKYYSDPSGATICDRSFHRLAEQIHSA